MENTNKKSSSFGKNKKQRVDFVKVAQKQL
jgi:hypothetical protein